jgi:hypothetical protein
MYHFILPHYILREHSGPFCFSFAIIAFIFLLNLLSIGKFSLSSLRLPRWLTRRIFGGEQQKDFHRRQEGEIASDYPFSSRTTDEEIPRDQPPAEQLSATQLDLPVIELLAQKTSARVEPSVDEASLLTPQLQAIHVPEILRNFIQRSRADIVLLANRNGNSLSHDNLSASKLLSAAEFEMMAKLAAGQIAATREMARCLGETGQVNFIFHEAMHRNCFIDQINLDYILITLVDQSSRRLGANPNQ